MTLPTATADQAWVRETATVIGALHGRPLVDTVLAAVARRLQSDLSTYAELDLATLHPPGLTADRPVDRALIRRMHDQVTDHPLFAPTVRDSQSCPAPPMQVTDVLPEHRWRRHALYQEVLAPRGIGAHTVTLVVGAAPVLRWYQFNRDRAFDAREMDLLARVQPALIAVHAWRRRPAAVVLPGGSTLTGREVEVLRGIADGLTVPAAARRLGLAAGTARKHLENVHRKLGTSGPVATVMRAIELGILEVPGPRA
ncbi:helix-turn-helix transcriptional regulator [Micromonospora robiginosa]|uniref:LuxR C-terminal-related transcriptional regulator n=1 Tax=Micromonospora robiginosa TaxID=2749844 RepID=A0A7L6B2Y1_9ACTN|nr:LuxR C-terminal-related transcriptional regulator [Micromonospora ferruginea]QLQ36323.1 LuxR C-terminal-related transcriptional regulator [Micromonospora ferruginea]